MGTKIEVTTDGDVDLKTTGKVINSAAPVNPADLATKAFVESIVGKDRLGWSLAPTTNGLIDMLGWYEQTDAAAALASGSPVTPAIPGYHGHYVIDVSAAVGAPFTFRFTGSTINESTGAITPADTEDIAVTANGYYQTSKSFIDAPSISIVEGAKSCTIDIYRTSYWDFGNTDFTAQTVRLEWEPGVAVWSANLEVLRVDNDGSLTVIYDQTFTQADTPPRTANGVRGKDKRIGLGVAVEGSANEGIVVRITQTNISNFYTEVGYE